MWRSDQLVFRSLFRLLGPVRTNAILTSEMPSGNIPSLSTNLILFGTDEDFHFHFSCCGGLQVCVLFFSSTSLSGSCTWLLAHKDRHTLYQHAQDNRMSFIHIFRHLHSWVLQFLILKVHPCSNYFPSQYFTRTHNLTHRQSSRKCYNTYIWAQRMLSNPLAW